MCNFPLLSAAVLFFSMESSVPGGSLLNASSGGANKVKGPPSTMYDTNIFEIIHSTRYRIVTNLMRKNSKFIQYTKQCSMMQKCLFN